MVASRASCRRSSNTTIILGSSACNSIPELKSRPFAARCSRPLSAQRWSRAGWCRADRQPFFPQNNIAAIKIAAQYVQMDSLVVAFAILGAILLGAISPGPSFVLVARTAVALSRRDALAMALGMGVGGVIFAGSALLGLMVILASVPWIYIAIKVAGAFYLLYLALSLWKSANHSAKTEDMRQDSGRGMFRSFAVGLMTQLSNPKTAIWYASIFTVFLSADQPRALAGMLLPMIFAIEAGWYALVAVVFSSAGPRRRYLRLKPYVDRVAGGVMGLLGLELLLEVK
jgi:threonine/homoserine/homoserine lactone efflux protein